MLRKLVESFEYEGKLIDEIELGEVKTGNPEYFKGKLYSNGEMVAEVSDWLELKEYIMEEAEMTDTELE